MSDNLTLDNTNVNQRILREYLNQKRDELERKYVPEARGLDVTRFLGIDNAFRYPALDKAFETEVLEPLVAQGIIDRNSYNQLMVDGADRRIRSGWYHMGGDKQKAAHLDLINNLQLGANANSMLNEKQFQTAVNAISPGSGTYQNTVQDNTLNDLSKAQEILNKTNLSSIQKNNLENQFTKDKFSNQSFIDKNIPIEELGGKTIQQQLELTGPNAIKTRQLQQLIQQGQQPQNEALELQQQQIKNRQTKNLITGILAGAAILKGD
tara:strand:+ start:2334 stop:3131 length:798 start_codon:yes stop_codon:yes gene_type:complete